MNLLDKFFITEINLVSQIRPQIKDQTLYTTIQPGVSKQAFYPSLAVS